MLGCAGASGPAPSAGAPVATPDPQVAPDLAAAHAELFAAADAHDVTRFRRQWSPGSRQLLERYFKAVATLERAPGAPPVGWQTFMEAHADLPAPARRKAPYRLVGEPPRLDLSERPEARFFRDVTRALAPEESSP